MSEVNGQTVSQAYLSTKLDKGDDPKSDSKMADGQAEIASRQANNSRQVPPMFREQAYNSQQQGALFPVHTIVVQPPGQPKPRGNFSKAAAVAMNRRPPPPSTYFIQHRQQKNSTATVTTTNLSDLIVDEGPTVKQHLQEQQKQLKAKERMLEQQNRQPTVSKESTSHNGAAQIVSGQVIRDTRTDSPQIVKTFTVQQLNSTGSLIVSNSRQQLANQQKRPPARPVPAETQPRLLAPRSRVNITNPGQPRRQLKVIVSPGVATSFTTAAQKQQLAQAPYVVSTTPLPPTAPGPPNNTAQISVHPLPPQGLKAVTIQKKALPDHIRKQAMPVRNRPDQPSEYRVIQTVTPVTTPSIMPKPRRHFSPPPTLDKMGELPLAILEGEEELIAKEQARKEEERIKKEAEMAAFEQHVRELKEREQRYLDQMEKEKKEEELRRFEQRHQEAQKLLDEKIAKEMKLKHERESEQRRRREEERRLLHAQNAQTLLQLQQQVEEPRIQEEESSVMTNGDVEEPTVSQPMEMEEDEEEEQEDSMLEQTTEPQHHLMTEPLGEVNLDDILQIGGDVAWNYQGVEQDPYAMVEQYPVEMHPHAYYNEIAHHHQHYDQIHHQHLAAYAPELIHQQQQMIDQQQQVIHHPHPGYIEQAGPIEDFFDKDTSLDKLLAGDAINLENFTDVLNDPNLMDSFPDFMDETLCKKPTVAPAAKKSQSPDNVMSLIDWISNDDHDIGDDGDDLLGLRDERLESTATEYLNVCADVDFAIDLDIGAEGAEARPSSSVGNPPVPVAQQMVPPDLNGERVPTPSQRLEQANAEDSEITQPNNVDSLGRVRRKGRSPQVQPREEIPAQRNNRRRNEDRHTRQKKAEMDAIEKEREAKQIAADCERVRQIMEMQIKAIQAEKEAEAMSKGPPPKKKSRSNNNRTRATSVQSQDVSPTKSSSVSTPTSGATPLARTPDPVTSQPSIENEPQYQIPVQTVIQNGQYNEVTPQSWAVPGHRQPQPMQLQGCTTTTAITGPIIATRTNAPVTTVSQSYPQNQQGPVPYADPAQYLQHHQQNYPQPIPVTDGNPQQPEHVQYPQQQFEMTEYEAQMQQHQMHNQYPAVVDYAAGYQNQALMAYPQHQEYPQQWYGHQEYYQPAIIQQEVYNEMPARPERTQSMDAGMAHETEITETAKKKNRRSNSFTNGMDVNIMEAEHPQPTYQYDEYGNILAIHPVTKEHLDNSIVNYLTEDGTTVDVDKDLEAAILSGNAEALEKVLHDKETEEILESYANVPLDILFNMMEDPHAFFTPEELAVLSDVHGIDTTEQLKVGDTNIGIEVPRDILEAQDLDALEDYEWKRILLQSFLHFVDEEKEEELAYMEEQCLAAHIEAEQRFETKMEVLKKGLTSFLYNNTAILDEITRLAGKLMVTSEERKVLARRLCHHQRNYIRRLQTASKRRSDAEKRRMENGIMSPEKTFPPPDPNIKKSHKKKMPPTPPAIAAARKSTVDRLVEEIMKTSKKRGRPFTKEQILQKTVSLPAQPTTTSPVAPPSAKKKERTASVSSGTSTKYLAPPPISAKRHSAPDAPAPPTTPVKEKTRERPPRKEPVKRELRNPQREEPAAQKKETPEIIVTPPKAEESKAEEKKEEEKKEETRLRRQRDRKQPVVKYEEPKFEEEEEVPTRTRRRDRRPKEPEEVKKEEPRPRRTRMKGYVYEEEPIVQPEPEPEPEVADPDAPIGLRKSARRSAQHLNFVVDFSPRNTPDPDDRKKKNLSRPRVENSSSPSVERRRRRGRQSDSISEDAKEDSSPNTTVSGTDGISPNTSLGENDNTTTSPDTPASDPPKEEDKELQGRRSLRARRPTQRQEEAKDYEKAKEQEKEDETPKKRRRVRTESNSTTISTSSNPPIEKPSTRQSTRRRS